MKTKADAPAMPLVGHSIGATCVRHAERPRAVTLGRFCRIYPLGEIAGDLVAQIPRLVGGELAPDPVG